MKSGPPTNALRMIPRKPFHFCKASEVHSPKPYRHSGIGRDCLPIGASGNGRFTIDNVLYWTGLSYSESEILLLGVCGDNRSLAQKIGFGSVQVGITNAYSWWNRLDLESEGVRFFAKTKSNQIQCIEQFLTESIQASAPALGQKYITA